MECQFVVLLQVPLGGIKLSGNFVFLGGHFTAVLVVGCWSFSTVTS